MTGLDERHMGVELALQANLTTTLSASHIVALSENIYTSRSNGLFALMAMLSPIVAKWISWEDRVYQGFLYT
ncbi:MAG: hypothetical protein R2825_21380 [Saprospiraceae bacterium]